jgi:hypothetical protein
MGGLSEAPKSRRLGFHESKSIALSLCEGCPKLLLFGTTANAILKRGIHMPFTIKQHVTDWVDEHPDGITQLRWAIAIGTFQGVNDTMARAWIAEHDLAEHARHEAEMRVAATRAAEAAIWSARSAATGGLIAVAALLLSAWPYIRG